MLKIAARTLLAALPMLAWAGPASALPPAGDASLKVQGGLPLYFKVRTAMGGGVAKAASSAPVTVRFVAPPTDRDLDDLRALGVTLPLRRDGAPFRRGRLVSAEIPASAVTAVAALPRVVRVALAGSPFPAPRPLDLTVPEVQAPDVWRTRTEAGVPITGAGVTVCDVDSGIDVFHPLFFRADAGYFAWIDVNGDGAFTPDVDGVDLDGDGSVEVLHVWNSIVTPYFSPDALFGSEEPALDAGMDWLYVDTNGNGQRDFGPDAGYDDAALAFGEPLFTVDDVSGDRALGAGEKVVRFGTSKIRAYRRGNKVYRRDQNLTQAPREAGIEHGTGASSVIAGGVLGLTREVGVAPDADLVMASEDQGGRELLMTQFCLDEGARVVLHEYAPWVGYDLDGSSDLEQLIDDSVKDGVSHINPAGNLSTSKKLFKKTIPAGAETIVSMEAPPDYAGGKFHLLYASFLWRNPERDLGLVLEGPDGHSAPAATDKLLDQEWASGLGFYSTRTDTDRGTTRVDVVVYGTSSASPPIPLGTWKLHVTDPAAPGSGDVDLIGYVEDELSGWGQGIYFPEDASEDHLIGYPGTADHGLAVAAYTGHGFYGDTPGTRAYYSGRGHRIDGEAILSISAPDDPIVAGYQDSLSTSYAIFGGTSGASPHVAGAAALLLQADPARTGDDVREAIRAGALVDDVVGAIPNDDYGYGKLRVYRSLYGADPPGGSPPVLEVPRATISVGERAAVAVKASDADEPSSGLQVELDRDYDGTYDEAVGGGSFQVSFDAIGTYYAKIRATDATGRQATALAAIDVVKPQAASAAPAFYVAGGGCRAAGGAGETLGGATIVVAAAAIALRSRRRARSSA